MTDHACIHLSMMTMNYRQSKVTSLSWEDNYNYYDDDNNNNITQVLAGKIEQGHK